jgi:hypothetical protein
MLPMIVFALTPLVWRQASMAPVTLVPVVLIMLSLAAVAGASTASRAVWAMVGGAALGAGMYFTTAAILMMPVFAVITIAVLWSARALPMRELSLFAAAFAIVAAPLAVWFAIHPENYRQLVQSHRLYDAERFNILQGIREVTSWVGMTARTEVYWDYLNPAFLFITGRVLTWVLAPFLAIGVYRVVIGEGDVLDRLALFGLLASPIAGALTAEPPAPARILWITPFAAVLSSYGLLSALAWWRSRSVTAAAAP